MYISMVPGRLWHVVLSAADAYKDAVRKWPLVRLRMHSGTLFTLQMCFSVDSKVTLEHLSVNRDPMVSCEFSSVTQ